MSVPVRLMLLGAAACASCAPAGTAPPPTTLNRVWMIGIAPIRGDAPPGDPFTNRLLADLAAMPNTQVVYTGSDRNAYPFDAWTGPRIALWPWLHGEGACMTANYTIYISGQQQGTYALVTPALQAGTETDLLCIDRFATNFYQALVRQGF